MPRAEGCAGPVAAIGDVAPAAAFSRSLVALVHCGNDERNRHVEPHLRRLAELGAGRINLGWQPAEPVAISAASILALDFAYYVANRAWVRYLGRRPRPWIRDAATFLRALLRRLATHPAGAEKRRRHLQVDAMVTAKHMAAWRAFLDSDLEYLVCFEDDAIFRPESVLRLLGVLSFAEVLSDGGAPVYMDLAGGFPVEEDFALLEAARPAGLVTYGKPVTNTACCYLINRALAAIMAAQVLARPELRRLSIDWAMNAIFMRLGKARTAVACAHAKPPVFGHGSFTGEYSGWREGGT